MIKFDDFFLENSTAIALSRIPAKELGMFNSMVRLPDNPPYGFWMDNHGNFRPVKGVGDHEDVAMDILNKAGVDMGTRSLYDALLFSGWVRIVINMGRILWEGAPGAFATNIQKRNMQFMSDFYGLKGVQNG